MADAAYEGLRAKLAAEFAVMVEKAVPNSTITYMRSPACRVRSSIQRLCLSTNRSLGT